MRQIQRILKHGNSTVVSVPRHFMYALNWICGQGVMVELLEDARGVVIRLPRADDFGPVTPPRLTFERPKGEPRPDDAAPVPPARLPLDQPKVAS